MNYDMECITGCASQSVRGEVKIVEYEDVNKLLLA